MEFDLLQAEYWHYIFGVQADPEKFRLGQFTIRGTGIRLSDINRQPSQDNHIEITTNSTTHTKQ